MTWNESWALIKQLIWQRENLWKFGYNTTPNVITEIGDTMDVIVSNLAMKQVNNEMQDVQESLANMRSAISTAIDELKSGISAALLSLAPIMEYAAKTYHDAMRQWLRRHMTYGYAKTGTNWTFTNGNTGVTCAGADGAATSEFAVGQSCYLQGDDPWDTISNGVVIAAIPDDDTITLSAAYQGTGGAGTIMRPETIQARNFTRGSITPYTNNAGDGTIHRMNTDEYGWECECGIPGKTKFECVKDPTNGALENQSIFNVFMEGEVAQDNLNNPTATTETRQIKAVTSDDNEIITYNGDFSEPEGAAAPGTKIPGWYVTDAANFSRVEEDSTGDPPSAFTTVYKKKRGTVDDTNTGGTGYSIRVQPTGGTDQVMKAEIITASLDKTRPYIVRCMCLGEAGANGDVHIEIQDAAGNTLIAGASVTLVVGTWKEVTLSAWFKNFNASPLRICLVREDAGAATMLWSNFYFGPYEKRFNGCWHKIFQGQSDFLSFNQTDKYPDGFSVTDSGGTSGIIQKHHCDLYDVSLPNADTPTIADPS